MAPPEQLVRNGPVGDHSKLESKNGPRAGEEARAGADWLDPEISSWW